MRQRIKNIQRFYISNIIIILVLISSLYYIFEIRTSLPKTITKDFQPYVIDFLNYSKNHHIPISLIKNNLPLTIKYGDTKKIDENKELIGYCDLEHFTILIDKDFWIKNPNNRQTIIDHELGHCLFERIHRNKLNEDTNEPLSIMYPNTLDEKMYAKNKELLRKELFNKKYFYKSKVLEKSIKKEPIYYSSIENLFEQVEIRENQINGDVIKQASQIIEFTEPLEITGDLHK